MTSVVSVARWFEGEVKGASRCGSVAINEELGGADSDGLEQNMTCLSTVRLRSFRSVHKAVVE